MQTFYIGQKDKWCLIDTFEMSYLTSLL